MSGTLGISPIREVGVVGVMRVGAVSPWTRGDASPPWGVDAASRGSGRGRRDGGRGLGDGHARQQLGRRMSEPTHAPVMCDRVVALLAPALQQPGAILVDATVGLGGHSGALLRNCPQARLVGIDRDPGALAIAGDRLADVAERTTLVHAVYDQIPQVLADLGLPAVERSRRAARPRCLVDAARPAGARVCLLLRRPTGHADGPDGWAHRRRRRERLQRRRARPRPARVRRRAIRDPDRPRDRRSAAP